LVSVRILFRAGHQCQLAGSVLAKPGIGLFREQGVVLRVPCSPSGMRVQMAKVLTPEESARSILAVFQASGAKVNEVLMLGTVDRIFLNRRDARPSDFTFGLRHAVDVGWVELTGQGRQLRLTQAGFDAMLAQPASRAAARR